MKLRERLKQSLSIITLVVGTVLLLIIMLLFGGHPVGASSPENIPVIRSSDTIRIRKYEDGPNDCYVAYNASSTTVSVSCVETRAPEKAK